MSGLVYSYLRFSDPRQAAGHSAERQMQYAARWAEEHGLQLDQTLSLKDEGLSAYHQQHIRSGALGAFLAAVEAGRIAPGSVLIVEGLDRLSRAEPIQAQAQLAQIVNAGITVVTASDGKAYSREHLKSNPMDLVYSLLVMIRAHEESDTKSKRVSAAIKRQCEGWLAGTYRGLIRNGKDPVWLHLVDGQWQEIPERAAAARRALELYLRGYSATRIIDALGGEGLSITGGGPQTLQIYRLIKQRALVGEKEISISGQSYSLPGYYPALIAPAQWDELQRVATGRGRRRAVGPVPHIITGLGITACGYCGRAMVGQNIGTRRRDDKGRILDGHRRLHCTSYSHGGCAVPGSISVAPIERAIVRYCSDMINLRALYGDDRSAVPRAALAKARAAEQQAEDQLRNLMDIILAGQGAAPGVLLRKAAELEEQLQTSQQAVAAAERELAAAARRDLTGADQAWQEIAAGVEEQDTDCRLRARQLVADTFERIQVYHRGINPDVSSDIDVVLKAKGGSSKLLRITRTGELIAVDDLPALPDLQDDMLPLDQ